MLTPRIPLLCSVAAAAISPMMSDTLCTEPTISVMVSPAVATKREPDSTLETETPIRFLISLAASAERPARLRTSLATTANPRPCSPARAASTAAFNAKILVWNAMPSMTPMMSEILRALVLISSMVDTTCDTTTPPRAATAAALAANWLASLADSADCCTVPVNCSVDEDARCRLLAVCSVRALKSWLPVAISALE